VAGSCEYGDKPSGSGATELVVCLILVHRSVILEELKHVQVIQKCSTFLEPEISLFCSQQPVISSYPELHRYTLHPHIRCL
jgi:hypothetical protein